MATKAIVVGESSVIRLCTARAIGAAGFSVDIIRIGGEKGKLLKAPDFFCKYVDNYFYFDETGSVSLPDFLVEKYKGCDQKPVLFTLSDKTTHIIDEERSRLGDFFLFAHLKNDGSLSDLMDKHFMKQQAESVGLSVVKGWPIAYDGSDFIIPEDIQYPCFVKGLYSYWNSKAIQRKCENREELVALSQSCKSIYPHPLYAEEYEEIEKEMGIMGLCDGEALVIPAKTELVMMGEGANHGVSILGRVMPLSEKEEIKKKIEDLVKKLGYVGIFNIDFMVSNGKAFFVELNLRYATYGYGIYRTGVNIPLLFIGVLNNRMILPSSNRIEEECIYLNEEVAYSNILDRRLTINKYKEIKKLADVRFVYSANDPRPMTNLTIGFIVRFLWALIRRLGR